LPLSGRRCLEDRQSHGDSKRQTPDPERAFARQQPPPLPLSEQDEWLQLPGTTPATNQVPVKSPQQWRPGAVVGLSLAVGLEDPMDPKKRTKGLPESQRRAFRCTLESHRCRCPAGAYHGHG
jgi:hypothetical protein